MDLKYFILFFFCGYMNNTVFMEREVYTTEKQPQSILFGSPVSNVSASSPNTTGNPLSQPAQVNISSGQPTLDAYVSSAKSAIHTSARQPLPYKITSQPITRAKIFSRQTALPQFTSTRQPSSGHTPTRQSTPSSVYTSAQQSSLPLRTSSEKSIQPTGYNLPTQPTSNVRNSLVITPGFNLETTSTQKTKANSTAAILVGVILTLMLLAIIMILLWKCLRKPVSNDQNWAGRSPFADGQTPDLCMDNIRENEVPGKRTSILSLMTWKTNKSTLLADDLEIKLFESSENIDDANHLKAEKIKDQVNGTSEESAGGSTIGTAVSSSDDADVPPPPPLLDLEGQESKQSDTLTTNVPPLPNDSPDLPPPLDCLSQACEDQNPENTQSFPPPPDSLSVPTPPEDFVKTQDDSNDIQCQELALSLDSDQDVNESLPLPPAELL
ncbi:PREDICTED: protein EVI2B [Elephantulus edwardii]|uniref:protein EVI2B n=1 Tax=Elephantulus edwardii TaxID=28737 RepID=UPI0003F09A67|nr:PREDICTED: protein EVI2B [Elephantulus edwardii]